ncbi:hexose transporter hxt1 [Phlyctochytrium bullatum]|nr:hexose transporter hxt1 [Phlyctochytrium bullatum]
MSVDPHKNVYTWVVAFAAGMGGLLFGYEISVIGQVLGFKNFQRNFGIEDDVSNGTMAPNGTYYTMDNPDKESRQGLITSTFLFGCIVGAFICSFLADSIGRKLSIILGDTLFAIGGTVQSIASGLGPLLVGRAISGLAIGVLSMVVPLYIAETAPPQIRGRLTTVYQLLITFGIFVANCINAAIYVTQPDTDKMWGMALGMQVLPAAMLVVSVCFIPRSPRWLAEKDRHEEGQAVIAKLCMRAVNDPEVVAEYDGIRHGVEVFERRIGSASWSELTKPGIGRRVVIAVINQTFQQLTGINVILYYSNDIFKNMGFSDADSDYSSIVTFPVVNALINFLATFPGMWAVERFGRKPLLVYGGFTMALAHALVFGFITGSNNGTQSLSWGAVFSIYLFL